MKATGSAFIIATVATCIAVVFAANAVGAQLGDTHLGAKALRKSTGFTNTAIGTFTLSPNAQCQTAGMPYACCTGAGAGTCGDNSACTGPQTPNGCCSGVGIGTCGNGGDRNTALGYAALSSNTSGADNTGLGTFALLSTTTGSRNTTVGQQTMTNNITGSDNTVVGNSALIGYATVSNDNTAVGSSALRNLTGSNNIGIGKDAGSNWGTGDNNIAIGNVGGIFYPTDESNTMRIGTVGLHTKTFIGGIRGVTTAFAGVPVLIDTAGQLGTISSSRTTKEDIRPMGVASRKLMELRPVTFRYKPGIDPSGTLQYGLIAEEVAQVMPELVAHDINGHVETVKYHVLAPILLNEVQRQAGEIRSLRNRLAEQTSALQRLSARVNDQTADIEALTARVSQSVTESNQLEALSARLVQLEAELKKGTTDPLLRTGNLRPAL